MPGRLPIVEISGSPTTHMQVVGDDLHLTAIVGAKQIVEEAPEHGLDVAWVESAEKPKHSHSMGEAMLVPALLIRRLQD